MAIYDVEKIINGTPTKYLRNQYNVMQENYTEESAKAYQDTYVNKPVSFLVENARYIFTEPYFGLNYFESAIEPKTCAFSQYETLKESVNNYMESIQNANVSEKQKNLYKEFNEKVNSLYNDSYYTRVYSEYVDRFISENFSDKLQEELCNYHSSEEKDDSNIISLFKENKNAVLYATYVPYVTESIGITELTSDFQDILNDTMEKVNSEEYMELAVCLHSLNQDPLYVEAVNNLQNRILRNSISYFTQDMLLESKMDENVLHIENTPNVTDNSSFAVNMLFSDVFENAYDVMENKDESLLNRYYETVMKAVSIDYQMSDDLNRTVHYPILQEGMTVEEAFNFLETKMPITEASDDDEDDDPNESFDDLVDTHYGSSATGKKPKAPKPKNLANRIQNSAMDAEARQYKRRAERKERGLEAKNAAKAVGQVPKHVIDDMKKTIHTLDSLDDQRRKDYMTTPGFRKKIFRNIKVAILYGAAASVKLALVPVVMFARYLSKQKDKRIRNELIRELETDIKVTEEKINDASAEGDRQKKYRLMRLRDKLEAERARVLFNSKIV